MGCSCGNSTKTAPKHKFIAKKTQYTILNVIVDEFLNKAEKASKYTRARRLYLNCYACDELFNPTKQCKKCGCFVKAKVMYKKSSCPIGKW